MWLCHIESEVTFARMFPYTETLGWAEVHCSTYRVNNYLFLCFIHESIAMHGVPSCISKYTWFPVGREWRPHDSYTYTIRNIINMTYICVWTTYCVFFSPCVYFLPHTVFFLILWTLFTHVFVLWSHHFYYALHRAWWGLKLIYSTVNHTPWQQPCVPLSEG